MKVSDLSKGMVLRLSDSSKVCWITEQHLLPCGEPEIRLAPIYVKDLVPGRCISQEELIVYLGRDKDPSCPVGRSTIRRVIIGTKTAVISGHKFKHFEPHPDFL